MNRRSFLKLITLGFLGSPLSIFKAKKSLAITPENVLFNYNYITPSFPIDEYASIPFSPRTNNLRRKPGSPFVAKGEPLNIQGFITDLIDIPLDNVRVRIWQANNFGYYNYLANKGDNNQYDLDFLSAGQTITNNRGYFSFFTILPGSYGNRAPHIHFYIEHEGFDALNTEMFFPNHPRNDKDKKYQKLKPLNKQLVTCSLSNVNKDVKFGKTANFNIKLNGIHQFKRY